MTAHAALPDFDVLLEFALHLAKASGELVLPYYRRPIAIEDKNIALGVAEFDPVTAADKAVEALIRREVERRFPAHGILGEEYGSTRPEAQYQWIIDPIDGTRAFMMGMPTWGTLIGLTHNNVPLLGVMGQPFTGELFWSTRTGAKTSGPLGLHDLKVRPCASLASAVLGCTAPSLFKTAHERARFEAVAPLTKMMRFGGDCYGFALVAAGQVDLVIEASLKSFDVAALIPIIERAGGIITTWDGKPAIDGGQIIAAGDRRVYDEAVAVLNAK
jgi:myo-inositol-1(or 4)-monophosphatase